MREYDLVLFGATGFTGALTAEYLASTAPATLRWALAGRDTAKLAAVRDRLAAINPNWAQLPLLAADVTDTGSLRALAGSTRVLITTVGPYLAHGEALVAACASAGTDYLDLCGEPEFVNRMYVRYHEQAQASGARLVHACGFDSVPYDLGVLFTVAQLPKGEPIRIDGYVSASGMPSGGTFGSALTAFSRARQNSDAAAQRRSVQPKLVDRQVHTPFGRFGHQAELGAWVVPLPTVDPQIVAASAAALPDYGPDFRYRQFAAIKHLGTVAVLGIGLAVLAGLAQLPPARRWLGSLHKPGDGPSEARRARSWFRVRFIGTAGGETVRTEVAGGDPGYGETAKILGEAGLCLALDELLKTAGQVTTATAMGEALLDRLRAAGLTFRVVGGSGGG